MPGCLLLRTNSIRGPVRVKKPTLFTAGNLPTGMAMSWSKVKLALCMLGAALLPRFQALVITPISIGTATISTISTGSYQYFSFVLQDTSSFKVYVTVMDGALSVDPDMKIGIVEPTTAGTQSNFAQIRISQHIQYTNGRMLAGSFVQVASSSLSGSDVVSVSSSDAWVNAGEVRLIIPGSCIVYM
jgi:hypothetical protein